jgi:subtilisin family serine protease
MKVTRLFHAAVIFLMVLGLVPANQPVLAQPAMQEINTDAPFVPGEVVVSFTQGLTARTYRARATALAGTVGAAVVRQYSNLALLSFSPDMDVAVAAAQVAAVPGVVLVQPNYVYTLPEAASDLLASPVVAPAYTAETAGGGDITLSWDTLAAMRTRAKVSGVIQVIPAFPRELSSGLYWGWSQVKADLLWQNATTHPVCLLDTGVDIAHPDLSGRFLTGFDFVNNDSVPNDDNGHGTHVAGIIMAKTNNINNSALGVSQAKIIPVKVLNAQGYGTSYSVAAGIQYCTSRTEPRVLNLSLGSSAASRLEYNALDAFIKKGRVVVAAAGNQSTSNFFFPAAWADPKVSWNASYTDVVYDPVTRKNTLHASLISVGSGRAPSESQVWVDKNGDNQINEAQGELFASEMCASGLALDSGAVGSNYGAWVNMVAPGDSIYSTTPVSNPFYMNYYYTTPSGYAFMSGTSMAAGFVSGAAAQVARLRKTVSGVTRDFNGAEIKDQLMDTGTPLALAVDSQVAFKEKGYDNGTNKQDTPKYGTLTPQGKILAPFCWPTVSAPFQALQDMSAARYLNVAKAMDRMALIAEVKDALTGLPVPAATVRAYDSKAVERGNAITIPNTAFVIILNLPTSNYSMRVAKTGYVTGSQVFVTGIPGSAGAMVRDAYSSVSLPPNVGMHFVLDWRDPWIKPGESSDPTVDFDLYLGVPPSTFTVSTTKSFPVKALIGPGDARDHTKFNGSLEDFTFANRASLSSYSILDIGTMLDPAKFYGVYSPYAVHNFDGGKETAQDPEGLVVSPFESISMRQGAALTVKPYYKPKYAGDYFVYITDPNSTGSDSNLKVLARTNSEFTAPVLRYWSKGYLLATMTMPAGCNGSAAWWRPMRINSTTIDTAAAKNICGSTSPSAPY